MNIIYMATWSFNYKYNILCYSTPCNWDRLLLYIVNIICVERLARNRRTDGSVPATRRCGSIPWWGFQWLFARQRCWYWWWITETYQRLYPAGCTSSHLRQGHVPGHGAHGCPDVIRKSLELCECRCWDSDTLTTLRQHGQVSVLFVHLHISTPIL